MKVGDDISIGLTMDSRQFTVQVKNANVLLKELKKSLNDTAESTKKIDNHLTGVGGAFRHFMIMAATARFALLDFHDVFLRLPMSIIKTSGEIERMTKLMEGLSTASDKVADAQKGKNFVFNLAQNAPFDVKALTDSFVKLKSGGIDPMNGSMQALVDSVAKFGGSSEQLHRASIAIQQMGGKGVVSMEELRQQLGEAVPDAINMMAIGVGKSMSDLVKSISKGEVESKSALERMFAVMAVHNHGAADAMMKTWSGMIEQLKTKWVLFQYAVGGGESGQGVFAEARAEVQSLLNAFDGSVARKFGADLSEGMYEFASSIRSVIGLVTEHYDEIKTFGQALLVMFAAGKLGGFAAGIKTHLASISSAYTAAGVQYTEIEAKKFADSIKTTENEQVQARMRIVAMQGEIAAKHAQIVALEADHAAANASYAAHNQVVRTGMVGNYIVENETRIASAKLAAQSLVTAEAIMVEGRALMSQNAVLAANIAATEALIVEKKLLAASMLATGGAATGAGRQISALGGAFAAVGGWLTVLQIALVAAVWAWDKFGNAAEKNAERARRAANGMSTAQDLIDQKSKVSALQGDVDSLEQKYLSNPDAAEKDHVLQKKLKDLEYEKGELAKTKAAIDKQATDDMLRDQEANDRRELSGKSKGINDRLAKEKRLLEDENKKIVSNKNLSADERAKQLKALDVKLQAKTREIGKELHTQEVEYYEGQVAKAKSSGAPEEVLKALEEKHSLAVEKLVKNELIGTTHEKVGGKGDGEGAGGTSRIPVVGSMTKHLNDAEAELRAAQAQQQRVIGEISRADEIQIEVQAKYDKLLANGELTKTYKEKGKTKKESINLSKPEDEALFKKLVAVEVQAKKTDVATAAVKSSAAALVSETELLDETLAASGVGAEFVNRKMSALSAEYEKQKKALGDVMTEAQKNIYSQRMLVAAQVETAKYHQAAIDESAKLEIDLTENAQDKVRKQYEQTTAKLEQEYARRRDDMIVSAALAVSISDDAEKAERKTQESLLALAVDFETRKANALKQFQKDSETPLDRLGKQWQDVTTNMQQATANWANGFMDQMTQMITTGKADWKKFAISILTDLARISAQKAMGGAMSSVIGIAGKMIGGMLGGAGGSGDFSAADLAWLDAPMAKGGAFTNGLYDDPTIFKFAKGAKFGVMGEAGPEAVMPLSRGSDGRLGVTMNGGAADVTNVTIAITVNNDGTSSEKSSGAGGSGGDMWKQVADKVRGVVVETISKEKRPGGSLYR